MKNDAGQVGMVYYSPINKLIKANGNQYLFMVNRAISFAWVNEADVEAVLSITMNCNCANSSNKPAFHLANDAQTRIWNGWAER